MKKLLLLLSAFILISCAAEQKVQDKEKKSFDPDGIYYLNNATDDDIEINSKSTYKRIKGVGEGLGSFEKKQYIDPVTTETVYNIDTGYLEDVYTYSFEFEEKEFANCKYTFRSANKNWLYDYQLKKEGEDFYIYFYSKKGVLEEKCKYIVSPNYLYFFPN